MLIGLWDHRWCITAVELAMRHVYGSVTNAHRRYSGEIQLHTGTLKQGATSKRNELAVQSTQKAVLNCREGVYELH